jgi:glucose-1-phosphate adenylyltransferase
MVREANVFSYRFSDYWVDVGTIPAYWQTNMELLEDNPTLDLHDYYWRILTRSEERPPVKLLSQAQVTRSLLSNGCIISGTVVNSVLSPGVVVEAGAEVRDSIIMNDTVIRAGARVDCCIMDKQSEIGPNAEVGCGDDKTPNRLEPKNLESGITIVGKAARIPAGIRIGRNCRIDSRVRESDFPREVPSGESVRQGAE